jgi:hypothetical protein
MANLMLSLVTPVHEFGPFGPYFVDCGLIWAPISSAFFRSRLGLPAD